MLKMLKYVENLRESETYIEQGHFMVGNEIIKDGDYLVSRRMEDHISWNDKSKIKRKIMKFKDELDDYEFI